MDAPEALRLLWLRLLCETERGEFVPGFAGSSSRFLHLLPFEPAGVHAGARSLRKNTRLWQLLGGWRCWSRMGRRDGLRLSCIPLNGACRRQRSCEGSRFRRLGLCERWADGCLRSGQDKECQAQGICAACLVLPCAFLMDEAPGHGSDHASRSQHAARTRSPEILTGNTAPCLDPCAGHARASHRQADAAGFFDASRLSRRSRFAPAPGSAAIFFSLRTPLHAAADVAAPGNLVKPPFRLWRSKEWPSLLEDMLRVNRSGSQQESGRGRFRFDAFHRCKRASRAPAFIKPGREPCPEPPPLFRPILQHP